MNITLRGGRRLLASLALFAISHSTAQADEAELKAKLPAFVADAFAQLNLQHGAGVAIVEGDRVVYAGGFGYANAKGGIKATKDTSFYIASSTKPITGLAALALAEKGQLDLNKSLADWFPEVEFDPATKADQITIRHLLSHSHGLSNDPIAYSVAYTGNHTPAWNLERLKHTTANEKAPFGTYDYSNLGYNIFSMILEREFGKPWQDVLAEQVFKPAGMSHSSAYMSDAAKNGWTVALPYGFAVDDPREPFYLSKKDNTMHAAGGVIASASDIARFIQAQLSEGRIDGKQVFPANRVKEAHESLVAFEQSRGAIVREGYGFGWISGTFEGEQFLHHFGGFAGASAHISLLPEHDLGVVILMNEGQASQPLSRLIAGYAYDMMRDKEGVDAARREELAKFIETANGHRTRIKGHYAKLKERTWDLSRPFADYAGQFTHPLYGTLSVAHNGGDQLEVAFGNMHAVAVPYGEPDTIRLELVPGSGTGLRFDVTENGVPSLFYEGVTFTRD